MGLADGLDGLATSARSTLASPSDAPAADE